MAADEPTSALTDPRTASAQTGDVPTALGGRPPFVFDLDSVERLASRGMTHEDMACLFDVSRSTILRRLRDEAEFKEAYDRGRATMRMSLRFGQMRSAINGNPSMLMWLGKQELGQRDFKQLEVTGQDGGPIRVSSERRALLSRKLKAYITKKRREAEGASGPVVVEPAGPGGNGEDLDG
jgi:hypothetical protein